MFHGPSDLRLHLHEAHTRMLERVFANRAANAVQGILPIFAGNGLVIDVLAHFCKYEKQQLLFRGNVGVDAHGADAEFVGEGADAELFISSFVNHAECGVYHFFLGKGMRPALLMFLGHGDLPAIVACYSSERI